MDLKAYLRRIGWSGPTVVSAQTLNGLAAHHGAAISFENLNPFLGLPVEIDLASLENKMVRNGRGGYCYEQNGLFIGALKELGFEASGMAARVLWGLPEGTVTARGHMVVRVDVDGETYIVDVGFGGVTLTGALRLVPEIEQPTTLEPFRLVQVGQYWRLEIKIAETWRPLYQFDLQPQLHPTDYVFGNHYTSTHPKSQFISGLMLARPAKDRRYALLNRALTTHHLNGPTERRTLGNADEFVDALETVFDLRVKDLPGLRDRFNALK